MTKKFLHKEKKYDALWKQVDSVNNKPDHGKVDDENKHPSLRSNFARKIVSRTDQNDLGMLIDVKSIDSATANDIHLSNVVGSRKLSLSSGMFSLEKQEDLNDIEENIKSHIESRSFHMAVSAEEEHKFAFSASHGQKKDVATGTMLLRGAGEPIKCDVFERPYKENTKKQHERKINRLARLQHRQQVRKNKKVAESLTNLKNVNTVTPNHLPFESNSFYIEDSYTEENLFDDIFWETDSDIDGPEDERPDYTLHMESQLELENSGLLEVVKSWEVGQSLSNFIQRHSSHDSEPYDQSFMQSAEEEGNLEGFYLGRVREVVMFIRNNGAWSPYPVGDWRYVNALPRKLIQRARRHFELRPLQFMHELGSARLFQTELKFRELRERYKNAISFPARLKEYFKLFFLSPFGYVNPIERMRREKIEELIRAWFSIWDHRLYFNEFHKNENSSPDWCYYSCVRDCIGVTEIVTHDETFAWYDYFIVENKSSELDLARRHDLEALIYHSKQLELERIGRKHWLNVRHKARHFVNGHETKPASSKTSFLQVFKKGNSTAKQSMQRKVPVRKRMMSFLK